MSSLPPRGPAVGNLQHATSKVNRFAKRDPALYPLSIIVAGVVGVAGYFFMSKAADTGGPARQLQMHGMVQPWDNADKQDLNPSEVAQFKYRHKTRDGHFEDSLPALNEEIKNLKEDITSKYKTT